MDDSEIQFILDSLMTYNHVDVTNRNTDGEVLYKLPINYQTILSELQGKMPTYVYLIAAAAGITILYKQYMK